MKWRFIDLDVVDPFYGPAAFEAVMDARAGNAVPDTILFWRPSRPAVYVGYHQFVREDVRVDVCRAAGVPIVRRILGGGAGYCDSDQIIYNVIFREGRKGIPRGPRGVYEMVLSGVVSALKTMGIDDACIEGERFGVYAQGKKISGSGQLTSKGVVNSSGSFLVGFDFEEMSKYLTDPVKNLKKGVLRPVDGLTCLRREKGAISVEEAACALLDGFTGVLGPAERGTLSRWELHAVEGLLLKYMSDEWTFRADDRRDMRKKGIPPGFRRG